MENEISDIPHMHSYRPIGEIYRCAQCPQELTEEEMYSVNEITREQLPKGISA